MHQFEELNRKVIGAAIQIHRELGPSFLESIYEEALKLELYRRGLYYESQKEIKITYLGVEVGLHRLDLVVENKLITELKAVKEFADIHFAQLRSYLRATGLKVGLLLNFASPTLEIKRVILYFSCFRVFAFNIIANREISHAKIYPYILNNSTFLFWHQFKHSRRNPIAGASRYAEYRPAGPGYRRNYHPDRSSRYQIVCRNEIPSVKKREPS